MTTRCNPGDLVVIMNTHGCALAEPLVGHMRVVSTVVQHESGAQLWEYHGLPLIDAEGQQVTTIPDRAAFPLAPGCDAWFTQGHVQ